MLVRAEAHNSLRIAINLFFHPSHNETSDNERDGETKDRRDMNDCEKDDVKFLEEIRSRRVTPMQSLHPHDSDTTNMEHLFPPDTHLSDSNKIHT